MKSVSTQAYLLYPFPHSISGAKLATDPVRADSPWKHWFVRSADSLDKINLLTDHSYSFLPHVRRMLYPELYGLTSDASKQALHSVQGMEVAAVRRAIDDAVGKDDGDRFRNAAVRLTWTGKQLAPGSKITVRIPGDQGIEEDYKCDLRWIDAVLFPVGVGVLVAALDPPGDMPTAVAARLMRFAKKVEYRRRLSLEVAQLSLEASGFPASGGRGSTWLEVLPTLLRDLAVASPLDSRDNISELTGTLGVNWRLAITSQVRRDGDEQPPGPFESGAQLACFALATGRTPVAGQHAECPSEDQWQRLRSKRCLSLWQDWMMLYHYDNLVQVVESADDRYVAQQFELFEYEYVTLFIYAIAQRHLLDIMESDLAQVAGLLEVASAKLQRFDEAVIRFNTRLWHRDVSTTPVGGPLYSLLRSGLELSESFASIREASAALQSHLQLRASQGLARSTTRTRHLIELVAVVGVPLGVMSSAMQTRLGNLRPLKALPPYMAWLLVLGVLLITTLIYVVIRRTNTRKKDEF